MRKQIALLVAVALLLSGCARHFSAQVSPSADGELKAGFSSADKDPYGSFGLSLLRELEQGENLLISPSSIALVLALTSNGAVGETRQEIMDTLGVGSLDPARLNQLNQGLMNRLRQKSDVKLEIANSIWLRNNVALEQQFVQDSEEFYGALVKQLNFANPNAVATINGWVKRNTHNLVDKVIDQVDPDAIAYLINAVYFKGNWAVPFERSLTRDKAFQTSSGLVTVPFMHRTGVYDYLQTDGLQAVRLPYGQGEMAMYVLLPNDVDQFCSDLTTTKWRSLVGSFAPLSGQIALPKFKLAHEQKLRTTLMELGIDAAFGNGRADFSRMTTGAFIGEVLHKAVISVEESGTEAAAVTTEVMCGSCAPSDVFEMNVNRPFLFVIHDRPTDTILFVGVVSDPR